MTDVDQKEEADLLLVAQEYEAYSGIKAGGLKEQWLKSKEIDKELKKARKTGQSFKLLVLGAGDSGKSTFCKQLTIMHSAKGPDPAEIEHHRFIIRDNVIFSMKRLLSVCYDSGWEIDPALQSHVKNVEEANELKPELVDSIAALWGSDLIKRAWKRRSKIHIPSNARYLLDNATRFADPKYVPNEEDILRSRARTTGIVETKFESAGREFVLIDVGGQRSERRKWAHCFEGVTAILFVAALDEYDMVLEEDGEQNRMKESIQLFSTVTKMKDFSQTTFMLFLNKSDLFKKKIEVRKKPLDALFPEYPGGPSFIEGAQFIKDKYKRAFAGQGKLFIHVTCALDRSNIDKVFKNVRDTLLQNSLKESGLSL